MWVWGHSASQWGRSFLVVSSDVVEYPKTWNPRGKIPTLWYLNPTLLWKSVVSQPDVNSGFTLVPETPNPRGETWHFWCPNPNSIFYYPNPSLGECGLSLKVYIEGWVVGEFYFYFLPVASPWDIFRYSMWWTENDLQNLLRVQSHLVFLIPGILY